MDGKMKRWAAISCVLAAIVVVGDLAIDKALKDKSNCANCISADIEDARNQVTAPTTQQALDELLVLSRQVTAVADEYTTMNDELVRLHDPRVNRILNRHLTKIQNILK